PKNHPPQKHPQGSSSRLLAISGLALGQDWSVYGGDAGGTRYSALKDINRSNVTKLKTAWTYHTGDVSDGTEYPVRSAFALRPLRIPSTVNGVATHAMSWGSDNPSP